MAEGRLFIGNRRYSSWSLRGWLAVKLSPITVTEVVLPLAGAGGKGSPAVLAASPSGMVPYLEHEGAKIWESLAIAEYCAEFQPRLWPIERIARAHARSIASEMHAGFRELRINMPMNLGREFPGRGRTEGSLADIARVEHVWAEALAAHRGPFLMGAQFTIPDVMFAPICARFLTWQPELSPTSRAYVAAVRAHPLMEAWYQAAMAEPAEWLLPKYENPA